MNLLMRRLHGLRQGTDSAFVEASQRRNVGRAVTELGEKAHERFGRMIRTHHQPLPCARHRELSDHALSRLDVTQDKVFLRLVAEYQARAKTIFEHGVARRLYVHDEGLV